MKGLIIGYGSAGKRHGKILDELGIEWAAVDPYCKEKPDILFLSLLDALESEAWDFVSICTPPDIHIQQIKTCLDYSFPILCEKPLCDIGQLEKAKKLPKDAPIMFAFNYRFHESWHEALGIERKVNRGWVCVSHQSRPPLPMWGLLVDHVSHTFDTLLFQGAGPIEIDVVEHVYSDTYEAISLVGTAGDKPLIIWDGVSKVKMDKVGGIFSPFGFFRADKNKMWDMFLSMYKSFLSGNYTPGMTEAIAVQELLEKANSIMTEVRL